eukprot:6580207-Pyramimonas_sp.AAC.1
MYFDEDNASTSGTDYYDEGPQDLDTYLAEVDPEMHGDVPRHEYIMSRRRWRQFSGKHFVAMDAGAR